MCSEKLDNVAKSVKSMGQHLRTMKQDKRIREEDYLFLVDHLGRIQKCCHLEELTNAK